MKKITVVTLAVLVLVSVSAFAAQAPAPQQAVGKRSNIVKPLVNPAAKLKTIYSNLGSKTDAYYDGSGYFVMGATNTLYGYSQDIALPFTPKKNATLTKVSAALQFYGYGTNAAVLGLYSDSAGLPGTKIFQKDVKNLPTFGTCCTLVSATNKGVKVKKGTQYWIVGTTDSNSTTSVNTWDFIWNEDVGPIAFQQNSGGWIAYDSGSTVAGAAYGH